MWRSTIYDMPKWVGDGLLDGTVERIEYSADHSADVVVKADGERVTVDMRRRERVPDFPIGRPSC